MQIIGFAFLGLVALTYGVLRLLARLKISEQRKALLSKWVLLAASGIFTACADYRMAAVLLAVCLSTWFFAGKKCWQPGVLIAVAALAVFKYANFFVSSVSAALHLQYRATELLLPLGISFYVFSAIGYLVDVSRGKTARRPFAEVALYLAFFPKLTSGPIQKSDDFFSQLDGRRDIGRDALLRGIQIFVFGLFKKIVLADRLSVFVGQVYDTPLAFGSLTVFAATVAYSLQIYFDFSGYSDMAIGVAEMLGFHLPRNFNLPYLAHNVSEFWKRWHISLSAWLQEYLYIPLGGNRKGTVRGYLNLFLTMVIGGLWHGANLTYVVWGALHGAALILHKIWSKLLHTGERKHGTVSDLLSVWVTFLFVNFCWIFFRAESLDEAFTVIKRIFSFRAGLEQPYLWLFISLALLLLCSLAALRRSRKQGIPPRKKQNTSYVEGYYPLLDLHKFWHLVLFFAFCGLILCLAHTGGSPFIYGKY